MTFSGGGDPSAMFIVKVKGDLSVADSSHLSLIDGASSGNVYVYAEKAASLGGGVEFRGHLIASGDVKIGSGTRISGRTVSVEGSVAAERNAELSVEAGILEICKDVIFPNNPVPGVEADSFSNRIWTFTVAGTTLTVPAGQCSAPFSVPSGVQTIQEDNAGRFTNMTGTWTGGSSSTRRSRKPTCRTRDWLASIARSARSSSMSPTPARS